mmetsp:Transcript_16966/g.25671  ORF Transcript_16966/g.25671 Transcript_16966/m.25671 type:complete len:242 (-) Transcript_16966:314-1039(-)|eukprot:CAMPEP_0178922764 /NCGR_PEP_ID=MMETSP0786-20121207/16337_1 /TAXON_ID=186022 /ORGANISM="Thalassionema frauenfeldii, Strain CCMP 1798" /LENGTH=241 /DNA_ID=CAMNT_0020597169 /DNA_START=67 /DNA_END=792 /DNA_ORIENTATION=+
MPARNTNSKKDAGRARKQEQIDLKEAKEAAIREEALAKDWQQGANMKGAARAEALALKADEAARKKREKAALLAAEEAELGPGGKSKGPKQSKKKGKKKDDLSLLEDSLIGAAEKKRRDQKRKESLRKEREKQLANPEQAPPSTDPLMQNTNSMIADAVGRDSNVKSMQENASGLDSALEKLNISAGGEEIKSRKALYMAFEERTMPSVKEEYPGLRLTQYKEKIFNLWKKSPENPENQVQ